MKQRRLFRWTPGPPADRTKPRNHPYKVLHDGDDSTLTGQHHPGRGNAPPPPEDTTGAPTEANFRYEMKNMKNVRLYRVFLLFTSNLTHCVIEENIEELS